MSSREIGDSHGVGMKACWIEDNIAPLRLFAQASLDVLGGIKRCPRSNSCQDRRRADRSVPGAATIDSEWYAGRSISPKSVRTLLASGHTQVGRSFHPKGCLTVPDRRLQRNYLEK